MGTPRCYYFGYIAGGGHEITNERGSRSEAERTLPFAYRILDAGLLARDYSTEPQPEGVVRRVKIAGWTVFTFWDRSGDSRPRSNSAFVIHGDWAFDDMLVIAKAAYPEVFNRITFPLVPEGP